jgi:hypothetical protein
MLPRALRQFIHEYDNGRALANARRDQYRDRFVHERIDAVARRLDPRPREQGGRGAA